MSNVEVKQCTNCEKYYDANKFDICPHCKKAEPEVEEVTVNSEHKKIPFWKREKKPIDDGKIIMPPNTDETYSPAWKDTPKNGGDKTPSDTSSITDPNALDKQVIINCPKCQHPFDPTKGECPNCAEISTDGAEDPSDDYSSDNKDSLREEIKKATGNDGKTHGYFRKNNNTVINNEDPVVGWLVCVKGVHFGESFNIVAGKNSVGRNDSNKIALGKDNSVSREKHAWITYEPKKREFFIQPGESSGLVYVNDDNIMMSSELQQNDRIEIGEGLYLLIPLCGEDFTWEDYMSEE